MSDTPAGRSSRHSGARAAASLRALYDDEVTELVELVLVRPAARRTVDEVFDTAHARFELGVRPERVRSWLLGLARELALTTVRERSELTVRTAEGLELLPNERTLLHLHRRCGIGVDELAEALSDQPHRLAVRLARLERRFLDFLAVRVLVVDGDSHCAAFNAIVAANRDRLEIRAFARGHAHSCPDCRELITSRAETTDMLGRPTPTAVRAIPVFDHPSRPRPRQLPVRALVVAAVVAGVVATAAFAIGPKSLSTTPPPPRPGPADVAPPSPVTGLTATTRRTVFAKPGITVTWETATDDVGVAGYEVYVDGSLAGQTADTSFVVTGLHCGRSVSVGVDAYDGAGNRSSMASLPASTGSC